MPNQWSCRPDPDGSFVITREAEGRSPSPVVARVYDPASAVLIAKSPELLGALQWMRSLLSREACQCAPGIRECVVCVTDDLLAEIESGTAP